jgi:hypothetical protein
MLNIQLPIQANAAGLSLCLLAGGFVDSKQDEHKRQPSVNKQIDEFLRALYEFCPSWQRGGASLAARRIFNHGARSGVSKTRSERSP